MTPCAALSATFPNPWNDDRDGRWVSTWSKPLGADGLPVVTAAPAYDQFGLPATQTWEKSVGTPEPVALLVGD
jgi:hypothetical protein